jgi:hypothetical protein
MKLDGGCGHALGDLRTPFQTGSAATAKRFVSHDDTAGVCVVPFPDAVHAGVDAGSAIETDFLIDRDSMFRKGLTLFKNLLVKPCSDHIQEPIELRAFLDVLHETSDLIEGKGNGRGKMFLQLVKELPVFQAGLALLFALAAVEAEIEGKDVRQFDLVCFESLFDEEEPSFR